MSPAEIRKLRATLKCTARELAATLGIEAAEVTAWEQGERFPTKKLVSDMAKLSLLGPEAISRKPKRESTNVAPRGVTRLADPALWEVVIKLVNNPDFFERVRELSANYEKTGGQTPG